MAVVNDASEQPEEPGEVETQNVWYSAQTSRKTPVATSRRAVAAWSLVSDGMKERRRALA